MFSTTQYSERNSNIRKASKRQSKDRVTLNNFGTLQTKRFKRNSLGHSSETLSPEINPASNSTRS